VEIVTPRDGTMLLGPLDLHICALTAYFTDRVASVEFFQGGTSLGVVTNGPFMMDRNASWEPSPFLCLTWTNVPPGTYALTAAATDVAGNSVTSAVVDISVVTNLPPRVSITKPGKGAVILGPTNITVCATASDPDRGAVTQVEFFQGSTSLGVVTNVPIIYVTNRYGVCPIMNTSYCLTWTNVQPGAYTLTAVATDNDGATTTSQPVDILVVTDLPPRVRIETPWNGESFFAPATVRICAAASDPDGTVTGVEFFSGTNSLGVVTNSTAVTNRGGIYGLFCFTWSGVAAGSDTLTAVATDNAGLTATSAPVHITVRPPPPPSVRVTPDGATFQAPANIWVCSELKNFPDPVASVQYFAGTNSLGIATNRPFFCVHWTNVPAGAYVLTATATDVAGTNVVTSPPAHITVRTNRLPIWRW
jgi:hypothetical protein